MGSAQRQWDKFNGSEKWNGPSSSRRLISRQSSTTSTSTSRSSALLSDGARADPISDSNNGNRHITDTLLESMEFLGSHGNLDFADKFYLETIFQRVLDWNNGMPIHSGNTTSTFGRHYDVPKASQRSPARQDTNRDADSPRSYALLREKLEKLKHHEKPHLPRLVQPDPLSTHHNYIAEKKRRRDLIIPDEDDTGIESRKYYQQHNSSRKKGGINREISHSSRETSSSSKEVSENSATSRRSFLSSMSSMSMDNGSLRGSPPAALPAQPTNNTNLATFLPLNSTNPAGSFESTASPNDSYLFSQPYTTSHAERVLMGLGFGSAEGFLPERFLKDWYTKISKAQTESQTGSANDLKQQKSFETSTSRVARAPKLISDYNLRPTSQNFLGSSSSIGLPESSVFLPTSNDQDSKMERLKEYLYSYSNNSTSIDDERDLKMKQFAMSRQKSLPLCLETLTEVDDGRSRLPGVDPFDKEARLQMFISENASYIHDNFTKSSYQSNGKQGSIPLENQIHIYPQHYMQQQRTYTNGDSRQQEATRSINPSRKEEALNIGVSEKHRISNKNYEQQNSQMKYLVQTSNEVEFKGTNSNPRQKTPDGNQIGIRAQNSPTRQAAIDVFEPFGRNEVPKTRGNGKVKTQLQHDNAERRNGEIGQHTSYGCQGYQHGKQGHSHERDSILSKDSIEVADIMQNQPNKDRNISVPNQGQNNINRSQSGTLKSALKRVEPAMVSIVLEDIDEHEDRCSADVVSVSQEGVHLIIPLSSCSSSSLSPIPLSPVTVIEVGLDNQQDSMDTEGTSSSKDAEDDTNLSYSTSYFTGEPATMKHRSGRRSSLSNLCLKPEHPQRRRSTGILSPIPCQLSLAKLTGGGKEGQSRRRLSLEVPVIPEIRQMLEKNNILKTGQSKESFEEPKKGREKRRASFSEAEPIIINDVLARERSIPPWAGRKSASPFNSSKMCDKSRNRQNMSVGKWDQPTSITKERSYGDTLDTESIETYVNLTSENNGSQYPSNILLSSHDFNSGSVTKIRDSTFATKSNNILPNINVSSYPEFTIYPTRSIESSPGSTRSAFTYAGKRTLENSPVSCNGYHSETDAEEFPTSVNLNTKPRPISSIAKNLQNLNSDTECEANTPITDAFIMNSNGVLSPTLQFSGKEHNFREPGYNVYKKVHAQMISRAIEVNESTFPYVMLNTPTTEHIQNNSPEYYYARDSSIQCNLTGSMFQTEQHYSYELCNKCSQTDVASYETSCQTTDNFYFVDRSGGITNQACNMQSKAVNTMLCLIGRDQNSELTKRSKLHNSLTDFNKIDETIQEIEDELSYIDKRKCQRSVMSRAMQSNVKYADIDRPVRSAHRDLLHGSKSDVRKPTNNNNENTLLPMRNANYRRTLTRFAPSTWHDATKCTNPVETYISTNSKSVENKTEILRENKARDRLINAPLNNMNHLVSKLSSEFPETVGYNQQSNKECTKYSNQDCVSSVLSNSSRNLSQGDSNNLFVENVQKNEKQSYSVPSFDRVNRNVDVDVSRQAISHQINESDAHSNTYISNAAVNSTNNIFPYPIIHCDERVGQPADSQNMIAQNIHPYISTNSNIQEYPGMPFSRNTVTPHETDASYMKALKLYSQTSAMVMENSYLSSILAGQEQVDRGHSKLSRLRYKQTSHPSSCSSLDIELDFMKAGEPIGMSIPSKSDIHGKLETQHHIITLVKDGELLHSADNPSEYLESTPRNEAEHSSYSAVSTFTSPIQVSKNDNLNLFSLTDKDSKFEIDVPSSFVEKGLYPNISVSTASVVDIRRGCETSSSHSLPITETVTEESKTTCLSGISTLKLQGEDDRRSTPEIVISPIRSFQTDFLQVPGSPDHIFRRAKYPSVPDTLSNSHSTSPIASPVAPIQEKSPLVSGNNNDSDAGPTVKANTYTCIDVGSALCSDNGVPEEVIGTDHTDKSSAICDIPVSNMKSSQTRTCRRDSAEQSFDESSNASMLPRLSKDSLTDGDHCNGKGFNVKYDANREVDVSNIEVADETYVGVHLPVLDHSVFKLNHTVQRCQSLGNWTATVGGTFESIDVDSNKSEAGSNNGQEVDDMDVLVEESRKLRLNSDSSYSEPILDMCDSLSEDSISSGSNEAGTALTFLVIKGNGVDDLLQVSDFGGLSPTHCKIKARSDDRYLILREDATTRQITAEATPSNKNVKPISRELPSETVKCISDSDDDLDSETELRIREELRQCRRGSRKNSKDNWEVVQSVLMWQRKGSIADLPNREEPSEDSDAVGLECNKSIVESIKCKTGRVDNSSGDECDKEISIINLNRPIIRKLVKMSSDPVDKDVYCKSIPKHIMKEKTANLEHSNPIVEETSIDADIECQSKAARVINDTSTKDKESNMCSTRDAIQMLTEKSIKSTLIGIHESKIHQQGAPEELCDGGIVKDVDDNSHIIYDINDVARVLDVEYSSDDTDVESASAQDRQDSVNYNSTDILDELEMIALFQKIDNFDDARNPYASYSSESSSSEEFKLSQISEEETQLEDNVSEGSNIIHIWQVRNRFVITQDTQDTTIDSNTVDVSADSKLSSQGHCGSVEELCSGVTSTSLRYNSKVDIQITCNKCNVIENDGAFLNKITENKEGEQSQTVCPASTKVDISNDVNIQDLSSQECVHQSPVTVGSSNYNDTRRADYLLTKSCHVLSNVDTFTNLISQIPVPDNNFVEEYLHPREQLPPSYETRVLDRRTDAAGNVITKITSSHTLTKMHFNSCRTSPKDETVNKETVSESTKEKTSTSIAAIVVGDYRAKNEKETINVPVSSSPCPGVESQNTSSPAVKIRRNSIIAALKRNLSSKESYSFDQSGSLESAKTEALSCEAAKTSYSDTSKSNSSVEQEGYKDKTPPTFGNTSAESMVTSNDPKESCDTLNPKGSSLFQDSLKQKVRSMFLIEATHSSNDLSEHKDTASKIATSSAQENTTHSSSVFDTVESGERMNTETQSDNTSNDTRYLQDMVRAMLLIEPLSTSKDTIKINDTSSQMIGYSSREGLTGNVPVDYLADDANTAFVSFDTSEGNTHFRQTNCFNTQDNFLNENMHFVGSSETVTFGVAPTRDIMNMETSSHISCSKDVKDLKDKVRAMLLVDSVDTSKDMTNNIVLIRHSGSYQGNLKDTLVSESIINDASTSQDITHVKYTIKHSNNSNEHTCAMVPECPINTIEPKITSTNITTTTDMVSDTSYCQDVADLKDRVRTMLLVNSTSSDNLHNNDTSNLVSSSVNKEELKEKVRSMFLIDAAPSMTSLKYSGHSIDVVDHAGRSRTLKESAQNVDVAEESTYISQTSSGSRVSDDSYTDSADLSLSTVQSLRDDEGSLDKNTIQNTSDSMWTEDSQSYSSKKSLGNSFDETNIKSRVRAMLLASKRRGESSLVSAKVNSSENHNSLKEIVSHPPRTNQVKVTTMFSEHNDSGSTSFHTSPSLDCEEAKQQNVEDNARLFENGCTNNIRTLVYLKDKKYNSNIVDERTYTKPRVLRCRDSLLKLHEQVNVFSSNGSDSDSDLMTALTNQGDYDIRKRDLALGRISSDNNDDDDVGLTSDARTNLTPCHELNSGSSSSPVTLSHEGSVLSNSDTLPYFHELPRSTTIASNLQPCFADSDITDNSGYKQFLAPIVIIQQSSEDNLSQKDPVRKITFTATTTASAADKVPLLSHDNLNHVNIETKYEPGDIETFPNRLPARRGSSSMWMRRNPHSNFLSPDRALPHTWQYNHVPSRDHYVRTHDDSHPELSYLDIVSQLTRQHETAKVEPIKHHEVKLVISSQDQTPHTKNTKTVKFK